MLAPDNYINCVDTQCYKLYLVGCEVKRPESQQWLEHKYLGTPWRCMVRARQTPGSRSLLTVKNTPRDFSLSFTWAPQVGNACLKLLSACIGISPHQHSQAPHFAGQSFQIASEKSGLAETSCPLKFQSIWSLPMSLPLSMAGVCQNSEKNILLTLLQLVLWMF